MNLFYVALLLTVVAPTTFGAKAIVTYRNKEYVVVGAKNDNVIIRVNNNNSKVLKPEAIKIVDDATNRLKGPNAKIENLIVTLQSKGSRSLLLKADIIASADLSDCFLILVSGSGNDVNAVARPLPSFSANQPSKISFTIKTGKFTKMEPYQLCLFSGGRSIPLGDGRDIHRARITPYEQLPRALFQVEPVFPESLKEKFIQAKVVIEFALGADGILTDLKALESPHPLFTERAIESLHKSRFAPRYLEGSPVSTRIRQVILFKNRIPTAEPIP